MTDDGSPIFMGKSRGTTEARKEFKGWITYVHDDPFYMYIGIYM